MTDPEKSPRSTSPKPARKPDRAERLADELRANLRRRKDQARGRAATEDESTPPHAGSGAGPPDQTDV